MTAVTLPAASKHFNRRPAAVLFGEILIICVCPWMAQTSVAGEQSYQLRRTEFGQPDLQGTWSAANLTPWERPPGVDSRLLTEEQAAAIVGQIQARLSNPNVPQDPSDEYVDWRVDPIRGELRSSVIIYPADGKLPVTPAFRAAAKLARENFFAPADGPEQRGANERCLAAITYPPMLRPLPFTQRFRIVQTQDRVVFHGEGVSDPRIVRLAAKHNAPAILSWTGDAIGWWEGNTLVVETTNFARGSDLHGSPFQVFFVSPQAVVTERFTRASHDALHYDFTVSDPAYYTQTWKGESQLQRTDERMYEYACHEGNYSLKHILEAARVGDANR